MKPLVSIIVLSYNSKRYIEKCLGSVLAQDYQNWEAFVIINGSTDGSGDLIKRLYGKYKRIRVVEPGENLWFCRGNNYGIGMSRGEYILALNQDTIMEPNFLSTLVQAMEEDRSLGSVSGKLLHYNFEAESKTKIIDSTGLEIFKTRRVIDRGQWESDHGQYDRDTEIFGASGAAAMYRRSALESVKLPKKDGKFEYFDEDFIAYKDDIDLSWRLLLYGYTCRYVPLAVVYHGRTVGRSWPSRLIKFIWNRMGQSPQVRIQSFKNHYLMMVKNEISRHFWRQFPYVLTREILLLIYSLLFEQFQVVAIRDFFRELPEARRKRNLVMAKVKVNYTYLLSLFH
ncbi:MAG: Glycosyl transferase, family 2 [Parcubacteria group bacterium GW2011_GWA2_51_12]|nr:MAG: Glycosyl transferase, family 2 [Parcubacteria group bacterium GW2011_GWA2_51_12]